ncbi:MAG: hypothetical protein BWY89_00964 [Bacteroidetes bacterium ADurb.BinA012]|nr:MAG: hypothetical protein BWY89_00964 [Bacteroidetes bacterium ADurb.BinA012]
MALHCNRGHGLFYHFQEGRIVPVREQCRVSGNLPAGETPDFFAKLILNRREVTFVMYNHIRNIESAELLRKFGFMVVKAVVRKHQDSQINKLQGIHCFFYPELSQLSRIINSRRVNENKRPEAMDLDTLFHRVSCCAGYFRDYGNILTNKRIYQ